MSAGTVNDWLLVADHTKRVEIYRAVVSWNQLLKKHKLQLSHTIGAHIYSHTIPSEILVGDRHATTLHTVTR